MNRIAPEQVKAAYPRSYLQPERGVWISANDDDEMCGCALTAVLIAERNRDCRASDMAYELYQLDDDEIEREVIASLGLTRQYVRGFFRGFDGAERLKYASKAGYADGMAAAALIFK